MVRFYKSQKIIFKLHWIFFSSEFFVTFTFTYARHNLKVAVFLHWNWTSCLFSFPASSLWVFHLSKQGRGSYSWKFEGNVFPFRLQALCLFSPPSFQNSDLQGLFLSIVRNLEYLEHISYWLSNFWQQSIPLGSAVCRSRAVTTKSGGDKLKFLTK